MSDDRMPYFKFFATDWLGDFNVRTMDPAERGIYIDLLAYDWAENGIPDDPEKLARAVGVDAGRMRDAWGVLRDRFRPHPTKEGRVTNHRLSKERQQIQRAQEKRSEAARHAAKARWEQEKKKTDDAGRMRSAMRSQSDGMPPRSREKSESESEVDTEPEVDTNPPGGGADVGSNSNQGAHEGNGAPPPTDEDSNLEKLVKFVGGRREVVQAVADLADDEERWALALLGLYGPSGAEERMMSEVPKDERPDVLATALNRYASDAQQWDGKFFRGFVRKAVNERKRDRQPKASSPDFGNETDRDRKRQETYRRREGAAGRKQAEKAIEEQQAELEELRDWYEDLPPEDQQEIDDDVEARIKIMATGTRGRATKAMKQAAFLATVKQHRESMQPTTEEKNP